MKRFQITKYKLHGARKMRLLVVSDIHFSRQTKDEKLEAVVKMARKVQPDYILMPGDLVDSVDNIAEPEERERLGKFLEKLAKVAEVLISKGNHDFYEKPEKGFPAKWQIEENNAVQDLADEIPGVCYLDNDWFENNELYVFGLTQTPKYYNFNSEGAEKTSIFRPTHELVSEMFETMRRFDFTGLPEGKNKILMVHSPVYLGDPMIRKWFSGFNYFVSGHMHNGIVPPFLEMFWKGDRGIVSPTRNFFVKRTRNTLRHAGDKSMVVGAVTTFHESAGPLHVLNAFYPSYAAVLEIGPKNRQESEIKKETWKWRGL